MAKTPNAAVITAADTDLKMKAYPLATGILHALYFWFMGGLMKEA
jgi:hypothetical protein